MKKIGFIGIGDMGTYMAKNLLCAGYDVRGYDIDAARLDVFAENGGFVCKNCAEVGEGIDTLVVMVLSEAQVEDVLFGETGAMQTLRPGSTVIITATIGKKAVEELARRMLAEGIYTIDCAVTGGQFGAEAVTLTMMAAGKREVFDDQLPVLEKMGKTIVFAGEEPGLGQVVKLCNSILCTTATLATFEALVLGTKAGIAPEILKEVMGAGIAGSPLFNNCAQRIIDREFYHTGTHIRTFYKDANLSLDMAAHCGVSVPLMALCKEFIKAGITKYPDGDNWIIVKFFEDMAGVEVTKSN